MIDFYSWTTPNGRKVSIALEELGLEYTTHSINILEDEQFAPEFLAISPNNKIPAIHDHDTGISLMESGAILIYLADKTGSLLAPAGEARIRQMEWLMWQMGGLGPMAGQAHHFVHFNPDASEYARDRYRTEVHRLYGVLDKQLAKGEWVAGDYSIADIAIWPWVSRFEWQAIDLADFPNVSRWYVTMAQRPAVQRGYDSPKPTTAIPMPAG